MRSTIKHLLIEAVGWVMTGIGAYFVYEDNTKVIPYIILIAGIILILFNFPYKDFRRKK